MEDDYRKITHGQTADSFKTAAVKRVPPPIPPRKRDSQLSLVGRKDSQPRLPVQQQQQPPDTKGTEGDLKGEKERSVDQEGSQEKKIPPEGTSEKVLDPVDSEKPQGEQEDVKEPPARHVSNGDADKGGGQEEQKRLNDDPKLPVSQNGSSNSECSGAKTEKAVDGAEEAVNHDSESRVARAEEIERDSDGSDSEETKPLLKESAEEKAKAEEKSEGGAILVTFYLYLCNIYVLVVLQILILRSTFECEQVRLRH